MFLKIKMRATGKIFGRICLRAISNIFLQIYGLWSGKERLNFLVGEGKGIELKWKVQTFGLAGKAPLPKFLSKWDILISP